MTRRSNLFGAGPHAWTPQPYGRSPIVTKTNSRPTGTKVAIYCRVSTDEQAKNGYSIADQKRELLRHAESEGHVVVETIVDDGYSGASRERPGLDRILELTEAGEMELAIATKRDRWFRSRLYRL